MNTQAYILITDDSAFMRATLRNILEEAGFKDVAEAGDGDECLAAIKKRKPDLLLLDVIMPGRDGLSVVKEVGRVLPVIMISAVGQEKVMADAMESGARAYVIKPFDAADVIAKVGAVLP